LISFIIYVLQDLLEKGKMKYYKILPMIGMLMIVVKADNLSNSVTSATDRFFLEIMDKIQNTTITVLSIALEYDYTSVSFAVGITILEIIVLIISLVLHIISFVIIKNNKYYEYDKN